MPVTAAKSMQSLPIIQIADRLNDISQNPACVFHAADPIRTRGFGRRYDPSDRLAIAGDEHGGACLGDLRQDCEALGFELGNAHLIHTGTLAWST